MFLVGKHLCGNATDCVLNWGVKKIGIALCCHCKAEGDQLYGINFLDNILKPSEINEVLRMTSW